MKNATKLRKLLTELSRDPRLKRAIAKGRRRSRHEPASQIETLAEMSLLLPRIASLFLKRKKARELDKQMDVVHFLVQLSLLLKENILDRPEVRDFFNRSAKQIHMMSRESLGAIMPKRGPIAPRGVLAAGQRRAALGSKATKAAVNRGVGRARP